MAALHEAIAEGTDYDRSAELTPWPEEFAQVRACLERLERFRRSELEEETVRQVGRFEIVRELGRGGCGVVLLAIDPRVGRQVALKLPRAETSFQPAARRRFLREARAAGGLAHPNIVPVYEVGEEGPVAYIAAAYCVGPNLAQWLAEHPRVSERQAAGLMEALASGVEHAHLRGVLHRDIKPSNILLEPLEREDALPDGLDGFVPKLTDFGLAKLLDGDEGETRTGAWLGTPAYMAPEQALGRRDRISPATDVYSLGVVLYELLAGRPPLRGNSDIATLQLVARGEVPPLRRMVPGVSRDLEAIVAKCLHAEPERRYASAQDLVDDLRRFRSGEPTVARPPKAAELLLRWARRRPAVALAAGLSLLLVFVTAVGGWWHSRQLSEALDMVESRERQNQRLLYAQSVSLAHGALAANHVEHARQQLAEWIPDRAEKDRRDFAWHYLWNGLHGEERTLTGHAGDIYCVRYSRDGRWLATASKDRTVRLWEAQTGDCKHVLRDITSEVNCVAFSRDSRHVAAVGDNGMLCVWSLPDGKLRNKRTAHKGAAFSVDFSPRSDSLVTGGADKRAVEIDLATMRHRTTFTHTGVVGAVQFSPSGKLLAIAGEDGIVQIRDFATKKVKFALASKGTASSVSFSANEQRLLAAMQSKKVVHWNLVNGKCIGTASLHYERVHAVAFGRPDSFFATGSKDGCVALFDIASGRPWQLPGHLERVWSLCFSPDGSRLATASGDRTVKVWNLQELNRNINTQGYTRVPVLDLSRSGSRLALGTLSGEIALYDLRTCKRLMHVGRDFQVIGDFDGDGQRDAGHYVDGRWHLRTSCDAQERTLVMGGRVALPIVGDWNGDGRDDLGAYDPELNTFKLDLDGQGGTVEQRHSVGSKAAIPSTCTPITVRWPGDSHDSPGLLYFQDNAPQRWQAWLSRGKQTLVMDIAGVASDFVPIAGPHLATPGPHWQMRRGDELFDVRVPDEPTQYDEKAKVWRYAEPIAATRAADRELPDSIAWDAALDLNCLRAVKSLALSPAADQIAVSFERDGRILVLDASSGSRVAVVRGRGEVQCLAYSPDGRTLAAGTLEGQLTYIDADSLTVAAQSDAAEAIRAMAFDRAGRLFTTSPQGVVRRWDDRARCTHTFREDRLASVLAIAVSPGS